VRVLVAEDNVRMARLLRRGLEQNGYASSQLNQSSAR
jgi:DNA-binding response OmpR family regulator